MALTDPQFISVPYATWKRRERLIETLQVENAELKKDVATIGEKLRMIAGWFNRRPVGSYRETTYTHVPRDWWLEGEPLLSVMCDIDRRDGEEDE